MNFFTKILNALGLNKINKNLILQEGESILITVAETEFHVNPAVVNAILAEWNQVKSSQSGAPLLTPAAQAELAKAAVAALLKIKALNIKL